MKVTSIDALYCDFKSATLTSRSAFGKFCNEAGKRSPSCTIIVLACLEAIRELGLRWKLLRMATSVDIKEHSTCLPYMTVIHLNIHTLSTCNTSMFEKRFLHTLKYGDVQPNAYQTVRAHPETGCWQPDAHFVGREPDCETELACRNCYYLCVFCY